MRFNIDMRLALGSCAAVLFLAGCSAAESGMSPRAPGATTQSVAGPGSLSSLSENYRMGLPLGLHRSFRPLAPFVGARQIEPDTPAARRLFVSDNSASSVQIYKQTATTPIGSITNGLSGPLGSYIDDFGTLYVTNNGGNSITEYPWGSNTPSITLTNGVSLPISVVVGEDGWVYVAEFASNTVLVFANGSISPTAAISINAPESLTLNLKDRNLYVSYNQSPSLNGRVMRFPHGKTAGVDLGINSGQSGGIQFDAQGNLVLGDQTNQVINIYPPGSTTPSRTISIPNHYPYHFAFNRAKTTLFIADPSFGEVLVYDYASGTQTGTVTSGLTSAYGVAVNPDARF